MDGTIHLGDDLLSDTKRLVEGLCELGRPMRFLSSNPAKDPQLYLEKFGKLGIPTPIEEITNTVVTVVRWLKASHPDAIVFPTSEEPLKKVLVETGIAMSEDPEKIDIVITLYDRTFEYRKLQTASDAIWFHKRAFLITASPDRYRPFPGGRGEPDAAATVAAIETYTGAKRQASMGKPGVIVLLAVIDGLDVGPTNRMMIGNRLMTNVGTVTKTNVISCLLPTGDSTLGGAEALDPANQLTFILDHIDYPIPEAVRLKWGRLDADEWAVRHI